MRFEDEVVKKIQDLETALKEDNSEHFKTVYESQIYILNWVMGKTG